MFGRKKAKQELGYLMNKEIIEPASSVEEKNGICTYTTEMKVGLMKDKSKDVGTYTMEGNYIKIQMKKSATLFVVYEGQYFNVIYTKI